MKYEINRGDPNFWASLYEKFGWPAFPVTQDNGMPLRDLTTTEADQIADFLRRGMDIAVPMGCDTKLVALEFRGEASKEHLESLLCANLLNTLSIDAGDDHYFIYDSGDRIVPTRRIGRGVDLLSDFSYVMAPPSSDGCGGICAFDDPDVKIAALPEPFLGWWAVEPEEVIQ